MAEERTPSRLPTKVPLGLSRDQVLLNKAPETDGGGRWAIIILFLLTVGLSLLFWAQRRLAHWVGEFF